VAYQVWLGEAKSYGSGVALSESQLQRAIKAAESYSWIENKDAEYPQLIRCQKSGQKAIRRSPDDKFVWDDKNQNILMLTIDEFYIQDVIV